MGCRRQPPQTVVVVGPDDPACPDAAQIHHCLDAVLAHPLERVHHPGATDPARKRAIEDREDDADFQSEDSRESEEGADIERRVIGTTDSAAHRYAAQHAIRFVSLDERALVRSCGSVSRSARVLAFWDGTRSGTTGDAVAAAIKYHKSCRVVYIQSPSSLSTDDEEEEEEDDDSEQYEWSLKRKALEDRFVSKLALPPERKRARCGAM